MQLTGKSIFAAVCSLVLSAQASPQDFEDFFSEFIMRADTAGYLYSVNNLIYKGEKQFYFPYEDEDLVAEFELIPRDFMSLDSLGLIPSGDYELVDSLLNINNEFYRFKVRFTDLTNSSFLKLTFAVRDSSMSEAVITGINLFPYTRTFVKLYLLSNELFIGEEKVFELVTNNIDNIRFTNDWQEAGGLNYRITKTFNQLQLHVIPSALGNKTIDLRFQAKKPFLNDTLRPVFDLPPVSCTFTIRQSRLQFLTVDRREVTLDDSTKRQGVEMQIDNTRLLQMQKTYRVEDQENPGGALIAEIFTMNPLTNNRALCLLRVYNYHRESEGYLYIKDGDQPLFITNFSITPKTAISSIQILREGQWTGNLTVYPGETIDLKVEGQALHKANLIFEELVNLTTDTIIQSETMAQYKLQVPININKKRINLYNNGLNTGYSLTVKEYQEPRPFDFIWINYEGEKRKLNDLPQTILVDKTVQDVIVGWDRRMIDSEGKLYGKQYLKLEMTVTGRRNELIEMKTVDNIVICPGINSPRYEYYGDGDCREAYFGINDYLQKKTHSLDIWSKIQLKISNQKDKYQEAGFSKEIDIILKKAYSFDIDLSFPAGLITISKPEPGSDNQRLGSLSGISIAMIAQFTFYHPEKINTPMPFKIGAGFLALNTFNFSETNDNRDLGIVILGSLYPTTRDVKLTFPLYVGGGYFLQKQKLFFLVGPGIRISF